MLETMTFLFIAKYSELGVGVVGASAPNARKKISLAGICSHI